MKKSDRKVTICVCLYGDYTEIARRCFDSIFAFCPRDQFYLSVGCNQISDRTREYVKTIENEIDDLYFSNRNLNKDGMHRRMLCDMQTKYHFWMDDDCAFDSEYTFPWYIETAENSSDSVAQWGKLIYVKSMRHHVQQYMPYDKNGERIKNDALALEMENRVYRWIKNQKWYRGGQIPSGCLKLGDRDNGYIKHDFIQGSMYLVRTHVLKDILNWPDSKMSKVLGDILLSESIKQAGYEIRGMEDGNGLYLQGCKRRGDGEDYEAFRHLFG